MIEEIKEILDYLKRIDKNKFGFEQGKLIDYEEAQLLLDYITNLQQNYNKLQDDYQEQYTYEYNLRKQLQHDLEKANDIIEKDRQFYKCRMDEYVELKKESEDLKNRLENKLTPEELVNMLNQELVRQNKCYKSRYKKAIEYIDEHTLFVNGGIIKSILKGSDNNE
ncbi:MAG: hypothetical protein IJ105_01355 [Bacilli bacterium]|nr:hypothetical protein [Bacilli bacterium]